jgi:RimJ/RimL family protein N-acetyltransferase
MIVLVADAGRHMGVLGSRIPLASPTGCCFAAWVMDIETPRLILHAIDESEARRICARAAGPEDRWAADYPFAGDLAAAGSFLRATEQLGEQRPFGYYQIIPAADGLAVGGAGFKGLPRGGSAEVGYGLAPSARGHGYATEALTALLTLAANHGVATVLADTTDDNIASQRTLARAGFTCVGAEADLRHYEISPG